MLEITSTLENARVAVTIVNLKGEIDSSNYRVFQDRTEEFVANGARFLLLNMKDLEYISSAGLRVIHTLFNKLRDLHKDADDEELRKKMSTGTYKSPFIKVVNLSSRVHEAFELSGFDVYIEVHDDTNSAVQSF